MASVLTVPGLGLLALGIVPFQLSPDTSFQARIFMTSSPTAQFKAVVQTCKSSCKKDPASRGGGTEKGSGGRGLDRPHWEWGMEV